MEIDPTRIDADTLRALRDLDKQTGWFRKSITCGNRTMWRGMDGYFMRATEQDGVTVDPDRSPWNALLWLIGEETDHA